MSSTQTILQYLISKDLLLSSSGSSEFNKSGGPAGHQVKILWGPAEIYTVLVRMSDTIFLQ